MSRIRSLTLLTAGAVAIGTMVLAQSAEDAVKARQAHMTLLAGNLGVLGGMARGNADYDAELAQAAADNLVALSSIDQRFYWPEGSSNAEIEGTKALPAIWEQPDEFAGHIADLLAASEAMAAAAGTGLEGLTGAMGGLGGACGACHQTFRSQ